MVVTFTATYSPEDNKLRLTASSRLDTETYERVNAAGFIWAPKQEQFVAPCWTPQREDLALELAGAIDDEDSTLMDRAQHRSERFEVYSEKRMAEAETARAAVSRIADHIPLGQPILVGHHSERHARKDAERIRTGMRKAVNLWRTSQYWTDRADAALRHARFKQRPDVRARRIKTLETEHRKYVRQMKESNALVSLWSGLDAPYRDGRPCDDGLRRQRALFIANRDHIHRSFTLQEYPRPEGCSSTYEGLQSLWGALDSGIISPEQARDIALPAHAACDENRQRWLSHLDNRLAYERAMLAETGYVEPPKKKSKAELPILNYGGTISYRNPYHQELITGEAVGITKAQWAAIYPDYKGTRISACGTHRVRTTMMAPGHKHSLVAVYLTDSKIHNRPSEAEIASKQAEEERAARALLDVKLAQAIRRQQGSPDTERPKAAPEFLALEQTATAGVQVVAAPQLFPTPPELADRMVELAEIQYGHRVLEPSAGTGNLLRAVFRTARAEVVAVEINPRLVEAVRGDGILSRVEFHCADFLTCNGDLGTFDRVVMNPPFVNGADIKHIEHAATLLRPGGVLVALCANGPRQREALRPLADLWEDLPPGSFKAAGTNVNVALLLIRA